MGTPPAEHLDRFAAGFRTATAFRHALPRADCEERRLSQYKNSLGLYVSGRMRRCVLRLTVASNATVWHDARLYGYMGGSPGLPVSTRHARFSASSTMGEGPNEEWQKAMKPYGRPVG